MRTYEAGAPRHESTHNRQRRPSCRRTPRIRVKIPHIAPASNRIYFLQRPYHRRRQRDTVEHLPAPYVAVTPPQTAVPPDHAVNARRGATAAGRLAALASRAPVALNAGAVRDPRARTCAVAYTWGRLPLWPRELPFIVELDNPYVLTLYHNVKAHRRMRRILRRILLSGRCYGIVCISAACQRTLAVELGADVAAKSAVVAPHVDRGRPARAGEHDGPLRLVCIGTQFWLKGGRELCAATASVAGDGVDLRLTMVTNAPAAIRARHADDPITFIAPTDREYVLDSVLPAADVFVLPTVQESYGLAALEAIACGLPVVATDIYALPELVDHGVTGYLLKDPLGLWRSDGTADSVLWAKRDIDALARERAFPSLQAELEHILRQLAGDRERVRAMSTATRQRFEARFSPERRSAEFRRALEKMLHAAGESPG